MHIDGTVPLWLYLCVFVVAVAYSAVGHGGASGYLALLSLLSYPAEQVSTCALILNILVAGLSAIAFARKGHLNWRSCWPFLFGSVPAAFLGGYLKLSTGIYALVLAACLVLVAVRLAFLVVPDTEDEKACLPGLLQCSLTGGVIGLLSGMVGIGGGVFLTPLLVIFRWTTTKTAAAVSAVFIVVNSIAGLSGRAFSGSMDIGILGWLILPALAGGIFGSWSGAGKLNNAGIRRVLAFVLLLAAVKLVITLK